MEVVVVGVEVRVVEVSNMTTSPETDYLMHP
jgi:hypothetical protein